MFGGKKQQFHIQLAGDGQIFKCELGQRALKKPLKDALILPFLQAGKGGVPAGEQPDIRRVDVSSSDADLQRLSLIYNASTSTGFQALWDQYRADESAGRAHTRLQKNQKKLTGSLEAMYPDTAPRTRLSRATAQRQHP